MREWVAEIQNGIAEALSAQGLCRSHVSDFAHIHLASPTSNTGKDLLSALRKANIANKYCADCGARGIPYFSQAD